MSAYEELLALAERGRQLAGEGRLTELCELDARWWAIARGLPRTPPADALPVLERALLVSAETAQALETGRALAAEELRRVRRTRTVRSAYAHAPAKPPGRFDRVG